MNLEVLKDLLGMCGGILTLVPFVRDFRQRRVAQRWRDRALNLPIFRGRSAKKAEIEEAKLREPSAADMLFVMSGLLLLIASFMVSLYISAYAPAH